MFHLDDGMGGICPALLVREASASASTCSASCWVTNPFLTNKSSSGSVELDAAGVFVESWHNPRVAVLMTVMRKTFAAWVVSRLAFLKRINQGCWSFHATDLCRVCYNFVTNKILCLVRFRPGIGARVFSWSACGSGIAPLLPNGAIGGFGLPREPFGIHQNRAFQSSAEISAQFAQTGFVLRQRHCQSYVIGFAPRCQFRQPHIK